MFEVINGRKHKITSEKKSSENELISINIPKVNIFIIKNLLYSKITTHESKEKILILAYLISNIEILETIGNESLSLDVFPFELGVLYSIIQEGYESVQKLHNEISRKRLEKIINNLYPHFNKNKNEIELFWNTGTECDRLQRLKLLYGLD